MPAGPQMKTPTASMINIQASFSGNSRLRSSLYATKLACACRVAYHVSSARYRPRTDFSFSCPLVPLFLPSSVQCSCSYKWRAGPLSWRGLHILRGGPRRSARFALIFHWRGVRHAHFLIKFALWLHLLHLTLL